MKKLLLTAALTTLCTLTVAEDTSAEMGLDIRMIDSNSDGVVSVEESALYEQLSASFSQLDFLPLQ